MAALLVVTPWLREVRPQAFLFPPSHYVARTAAGGLLALLMLLSWAHVALPKRLRLLAVLHDPTAGRRLATAMLLLVLGGAGVLLLAWGAFGPARSEVAVTVAGASTLVVAHLWNWRRLRHRHAEPAA